MAKHLLPSRVLGQEGPLILKLLHSENDPLLKGSIYSSKPSISVVTALYIYLESTLQVGKLRLRDRRWPGARGHWGNKSQEEGKQEVSQLSQGAASACLDWEGKGFLFLPAWGGWGSAGKGIGKERQIPILMAGALPGEQKAERA